jgi:hypothetical protein
MMGLSLICLAAIAMVCLSSSQEVVAGALEPIF